MAIQVSQDGLWITGDMFNGMTPNPRFGVKKDQVINFVEATWMTDANGDPVTVTQIMYSANATSVNALATYDEVLALISPTTP